MSYEVEHLNEQAKAALELEDKERIERVRNARWIGYTHLWKF